MAACEAWSLGGTRFSYLLPLCFSLPFSFFSVCVVFFSLRFLFNLRGFFFICFFSCLLACFLFCLRGFLFCSRGFFFVCVVSFLFAWFLFCLRRFFFCFHGFFSVCSVSLVGHRKIVLFVQLEIWGVNLPHLTL